MIFFDWGDTLATWAIPWREMWATALAESGHPVEPARLRAALQPAEDWLEAHIYEYAGRTREMWRAHDGIMLRELGIPDPDGSLAGSFERSRLWDRWLRLFPEVPEALDDLRTRGYALGIVSNNTDDILHRIRTTALTGAFRWITYSQEAGAEKPDPAIFRLALSRAGVTAAEAVHVGDQVPADVVGARAAGLTPILVDRKGDRPAADCWRVRDLREIAALLESRPPPAGP